MRLKIILHVAYPRSTQAQINARTPTWVNQKGYTTLHKLTYAAQNNFAYTTLHKLTYAAQNNFACCISQEHSGTNQCQDSNLGEPERIYSIT